MADRAFMLGWYEGICAKYKNDKSRRCREYADYLDKWLHCDDVIDGCDKEFRLKYRLPMSLMAYFG